MENKELPRTAVGDADREISPEREKEVMDKFRKWGQKTVWERRQAQEYVFKPDFPQYQNLPIPPGCKKELCCIIAPWTFLDTVYEVEFTFEIVFGSKNSREKKMQSMAKKMKALLELSTLTTVTNTPGFVVKPYVQPTPVI